MQNKYDYYLDENEIEKFQEKKESLLTLIGGFILTIIALALLLVFAIIFQ